MRQWGGNHSPRGLILVGFGGELCLWQRGGLQVVVVLVTPSSPLALPMQSCSDRSAAAPASATSAAAPPHSAPSTASTVKTRVSASTGQHARFQHGHTKEPPPPEERERLTLEIQRREFFEVRVI